MNAQILAFLNPEDSEEPRLSPHLKKLENLATGKLIHIRDGEVTLYKRTKSARWQMTFRLYNKKWLRITTGYSDLEYAKKKAGEIYDRARFMEEMGFPISPKKFKVVAEQLITELQQDLEKPVSVHSRFMLREKHSLLSELDFGQEKNLSFKTTPQERAI